MSPQNLDELCINTIRTLSIDAVQQANSGHPGAPMGLAPVVYSLWQKFSALRSRRSPLAQSRPLCAFRRPRFHAALFHAAPGRRPQVNAKSEVQNPGSLAVSMEEIKRFRQLGSNTPGHPESHITTGVETTTGPLGQGAGNSVGMAIASKVARRPISIKPGFDIFDFKCLCRLRRRRFHGRRGERSRVACRPSEALESLLDLRQQPRHARWSGQIGRSAKT